MGTELPASKGGIGADGGPTRYEFENRGVEEAAAVLGLKRLFVEATLGLESFCGGLRGSPSTEG